MKNKIDNLYKQAVLNKDQKKKIVLVMLRSNIKNKEIELRSSGKELSDSDILAIIQKTIKQNNESISCYKAGNREDLVESCEQENQILLEFLPKQLDAIETDKILLDIIKENSITSVKEMGKVMGILKTKYSGQVDLNLASILLKDRF